jgi:hypothetical protein
MRQVGFERTNPVFQVAKTVHALDRAATVIGTNDFTYRLYAIGQLAMLLG